METEKICQILADWKKCNYDRNLFLDEIGLKDPAEREEINDMIDQGLHFLA